MATVSTLKPKNAARWRVELGRFIRFGLVGVSGTVIDFVILTALKYFWGWATLPANILSYSVGILNNYLLTRHWVCPENRRQSWLQLAQFATISLIGLALNNLIVMLLEKPLGNLLANPAYGYLPAKIIATAVVLGWNFSGNRLWTFGENRPAKLAPVMIREQEDYEQKAA
jgi:putative flippase GtrA